MAKLISLLNARLLYVVRDLKLKWAPRKLPLYVHTELHFPDWLTVVTQSEVSLSVSFFVAFVRLFILHRPRYTSGECLQTVPWDVADSPLENCRILFSWPFVELKKAMNEKLFWTFF